MPFATLVCTIGFEPSTLGSLGHVGGRGFTGAPVEQLPGASGLHPGTMGVPCPLDRPAQVSLGGELHGISCLGYAFSAFEGQAVIIDQASTYLGCLFVPHTRNHEELAAILDGPEAAAADAIFVHADVTGAFMNDNVVSSSGVSVKHFPDGVPAYSGHFHKPHSVAGKVVSFGTFAFVCRAH